VAQAGTFAKGTDPRRKLAPRTGTGVPIDVKEAAREHTMLALNTLVDVCRTTKYPAAARVSAANSLHDRGYGKPSQEITGKDGGPLFVPTVRIIVGPAAIGAAVEVDGSALAATVVASAIIVQDESDEALRAGVRALTNGHSDG
jgi:hypothetical protein